VANPIVQFKGTGYAGMFCLSAFSFDMQHDGCLDLFEQQTGNVSENSAMDFCKFLFFLLLFDEKYTYSVSLIFFCIVCGT
jgi:hypothetical protein